MSNSISTKDLKRPDATLGFLRGLMNFILDNKVILLSVLGVVTVGWLGWWGYQGRQEARDEAELAELFRLEKTHATDAEKKETKSSADGRFEEQLKQFLQAKKGAKAQIHAALTLSQFLEKKQDWEGMLAVLDPVTKFVQGYELMEVTVGTTRARALEGLGRNEEALKVYRQLGALSSTFPKSFFKIAEARCLFQLGQAEEATTLLEAIAKDAKDPYSAQAKGLKRFLASRGANEEVVK